MEGRPKSKLKFRPCIDIHNGQVKQIVGGTLRDEGNRADENFVAENGADFFAELYRRDGLSGGHAIILNKAGTPEYEATKVQALKGLGAYPGGLQIGGGITAENAREFLEAGASHVIVTSYVFSQGKVNYENLNKLVAAVGKDHVVLDLSCRIRDGRYYVVTDRWQNFTDEELTQELFEKLENSCDEFLIHAADVEGKKAGIDEKLISLLAEYTSVPTTYAGGVGCYEDIVKINLAGKGRIDFTVGSALDIFGGSLSYERLAEEYK